DPVRRSGRGGDQARRRGRRGSRRERRGTHARARFWTSWTFSGGAGWMPAIVIVGAQWGDEGKGKIVDIYTEHADMVVRYGGGPNAGHTLVVGNDKLVVRLIPSGILRPKTSCVLAQGMVIDPASLVTELDELEKRGLTQVRKLVVS